MSDLDSNNDPIARTTLRRLMMEKSGDELQVEGDLELVMKQHLETAFEEIWNEAINQAKQDNVRTVRKEHIRRALNKIFEPQALLEEAISVMNNYQYELGNVADQSPLIETGMGNDGEE